MFLKRLKLFFVIYLFIFQVSNLYAENVRLTLQTVNLPDAIRLVAKFLKMNIVISPAVQGQAVLNLQQASPVYAWNMLLTAHGLASYHVGNLWFVAPRNEILKLQQDEMKLQELKEESNALVMQFWQLKYAKVEDVMHMIEDAHNSLLSKRGHIRADIRTNILYLHDTSIHIAQVRQLLRHLDIPVRQIRIAVRLVSIDSDFERELGLQFVEGEVGAGNKNDKNIHSLRQDVGRYSLVVAKLADRGLLDIKLSALEESGHAELISSPSLFTSNLQTASIEAGEEVPYQEVSESGGTAVVFKKAVLGLKVTPQILPGDHILLQLQINQDRPSNKMVQGMPTISTRQMMTNILIKSGKTIVLGGIYEVNRENAQSGIPFLNQLPLLRFLFQQQHSRKNKRELLVFVTPQVY